MGSIPQPPRAPVAPPPPRTGSTIVVITLLILALIIVVSGVVVYTGVRVISRNVQVHVEDAGAGKKELTIHTPVGSLEVKKEVNEASLGLPIYPGAVQLKDEGGASVNLNFPNEENVRVLAGKFETPDPRQKVTDFYRQRLGTDVTKFTERSPEGKTVFEIKRNDQEKVVAIKDRGDGALIELVRITHGRAQVN